MSGLIIQTMHHTDASNAECKVMTFQSGMRTYGMFYRRTVMYCYDKSCFL